MRRHALALPEVQAANQRVHIRHAECRQHRLAQRRREATPIVPTHHQEDRLAAQVAATAPVTRNPTQGGKRISLPAALRPRALTPLPQPTTTTSRRSEPERREATMSFSRCIRCARRNSARAGRSSSKSSG